MADDIQNGHDQRLAFLGIGPETAILLQQLWADLGPELPALLDAFYDHVTDVPELAALIGDRLPYLKAAQAMHWARLFSGRFDDDYMIAVQAIGAAHSRIGLAPRWYIGAYNFFLSRLSQIASAKHADDLERRNAMLAALNAAIMLDIDLVLTAYHEAMSEALRDEHKKATDEARARFEFLGHMSHELRTPLNAICGFSEILRDGHLGPLPPRHAAYAGDIHNAAQHLLALINDVLDMAKVESGEIELDEHWIDLPSLLNDCAHLVSLQAAKAGISLEQPLDGDRIEVLGDRRRIRQIVLNLLSNAIKFTPSGGRVSLGISGGGEDGLAVSVADTGAGMTPEQVREALKPFRQVRSEVTKDNTEGTGLGLPLADALIRLHGGKLDIRSTPGVGTRVQILVPAERVRITRSEPVPPAKIKAR